MRIDVKVVFDAAGRVVALCHEHPDSNPIGQGLVTELMAQSGRADSKLEQFRGGVLDAKNTLRNRKGVERRIRGDFDHLRRIADTAALRQPDQLIPLKVPGRKGSIKSFVAASRQAVAVAKENQALLETYGMPDTLLAEITALIDEFVRLREARSVAIQSHVGATAELPSIARDMMRTIKHLNALNLIRFADNTELLAAWKSASEIQGPPRLSRKKGAKKGELSKAA